MLSPLHPLYMLNSNPSYLYVPLFLISFLCIYIQHASYNSLFNFYNNSCFDAYQLYNSTLSTSSVELDLSLFICLFINLFILHSGDGIQDTEHPRQVLCHWAASPALLHFEIGLPNLPRLTGHLGSSYLNFPSTWDYNVHHCARQLCYNFKTEFTINSKRCGKYWII